jgi:hypothetical protein
MYLVYSLLTFLVFVIVSPYFVYQAIRYKKYIGSLRDRLGYLPISFNIDGEESIWIHAVSVGEALTARALAADLKARYPRLRLFLSTTTIAGQQVARRSLSNAEAVFYFPGCGSERLFSQVGLATQADGLVGFSDQERGRHCPSSARIWPSTARAIRYRRERWVTPDGRTVIAPLPLGVTGHFGPEVAPLCAGAIPPGASHGALVGGATAGDRCCHFEAAGDATADCRARRISHRSARRAAPAGSQSPINRRSPIWQISSGAAASLHNRRRPRQRETCGAKHGRVGFGAVTLIRHILALTAGSQTFFRSVRHSQAISTQQKPYTTVRMDRSWEFAHSSMRRHSWPLCWG